VSHVYVLAQLVCRSARTQDVVDNYFTSNAFNVG